MTMQIDILNPKATQLLRDVEDLNLISIRDSNPADFLKTLAKIRNKAASDSLNDEEITDAVEKVRSKRYAAKKATC